MQKIILTIAMALVSSVCLAQDFLASKVVPASGTTGAKYIYTNGQIGFTLQEKDGDMSLATMLIAPKGKSFKSSKAHLVNIDLCQPDGIVIQSIKYYTWVQSSRDKLLFYDDAIFGFHAEHASQESKCNCYSKDVFSNVDLWNFVCNEDGYVKLSTETKDGELEVKVWTIPHTK